MTLRHVALVMIALVAPAFVAQAIAVRNYRPVRIGFGGPELDACGSRGRVKGLNPKGDNFLAVKAAPNLKAQRTDMLHNGDIVDVCESTADNGWLGVVYVHGGKAPDTCGLYSPVSQVRAYTGPCKSGWVASKYVNIFAG